MPMNHLSSHALIARLNELVALERRTIVDELLCLIEIERRRIHLEMSSSMWSFCVDRLKWSKGTTYRRTTAAEMIAKWPVIADYLRDGRLSATTLVLLKDVIEKDPKGVLERAAGKTEDEVKELVAAMQPRDVFADLFTRVNAGANGSNESDGQSSLDREMTGVGSKIGEQRAAASAAAVELQRAMIEPVSAELRRMHVT